MRAAMAEQAAQSAELSGVSDLRLQALWITRLGNDTGLHHQTKQGAGMVAAVTRDGMTNLQAFFLGMMVAYTPSLLLLAWVLWKEMREQ